MKVFFATGFICFSVTSVVAQCGVPTLPIFTENVGEYTYFYTTNSYNHNGEAELYNNGTVAISPSPVGDLSLPSTLGGYPVTSIGPKAFSGCSGLTNIVVSHMLEYVSDDAFLGTPWYNNQADGVVYLGKGAYWYKGICPENVILRQDTIAIGESAFSECNGLISITIPDGVTFIGGSAFSYCSGLMSITIPDSVTFIGKRAFAVCPTLCNMTIPPSVTVFQEDAFEGVALRSLFFDNARVSILNAFNTISLHNLCLGASVTNITGPMFSDFPELETISVTGNNAHYKSDNYGVLYTKDCGEIVKYPANNPRQGYVIPSSVKRIGEKAFYNVNLLYEIVLPEGVCDIGADAFNWCLALQSVSFPSSVTNISDRAFDVCPSLLELKFAGEAPTFGSDICRWSSPVLYVPHLTEPWILAGDALGLDIFPSQGTAPIVLSVGGVTVTNILSHTFFSNVTQQAADTSLATYLSTYPSATAEQIGRLLSRADAMGLTMELLAQGTNIVLFAPELSMSAILFPTTSAPERGLVMQSSLSTRVEIVFTVLNGITDPYTAVALLRDSTTRMIKVEYAGSLRALSDPAQMNSVEPLLAFSTDNGTVTATLSTESLPLTGFFRTRLTNTAE